MARLENELGAPLKERQGRRVRLTRYGRAFLVHAERALQAMEAGKREVAFEGEDAETVTGLASAELDVGFIPALAVSERSNVRYLRVNAPRAQRIIALAWMEGRYLSAAATLFRDCALAYFAHRREQANP